MKNGDAARVNSVNDSSRCVVCGLCDVRALATVRLAGGVPVVVCGTHELMHRRLGKTMKTVEELRAEMRERRRPMERRESLPGDELAAALTAAFAGERRKDSQRRS